MEPLQLELFQGFDTFSGNPRNTVVRGTSGTPSSASTSYVSVCTTVDQLQDALQIDASVSGTYKAFTADAKSEYVHSLNLTTNSVVVVVYASNTLTTGMTNAALPGNLKLANSTEVEEFVRANGDCFVSQITKGGEYFATFTFMSQTTEEKTAVEASLGVTATSQLDASVSAKLTATASSTNVQFAMNQMLTGIRGVAPPSATSPSDIGGMVNFAIGFPALTMNFPALVSFAVEPYEQILGASVPFNGVTQNRTAFLGNPATMGWGQMIAQLQGAMNDCNAIKSLYAHYANHQDSGFESRSSQVQQDLKELYAYAASVDEDPATDRSGKVPAAKSISYGIPEAQYTVLVPVSQNFLHGDYNPDSAFPQDADTGSFSQDVSSDQISQLWHLDEVSAWSTTTDISNDVQVESLNQVVLTYSTQFPQQTTVTVTHGPQGGEEIFQLSLGDNEFITTMAGWLNTLKTPPSSSLPSWSLPGGLVFRTSAGQTASNSGGTPTDSWSAGTSGDILIGFAGYTASNGYMVGIQPLVLRFHPIQWTQPPAE
jgi:jacalin-like lectin domain-containing protein